MQVVGRADSDFNNPPLDPRYIVGPLLVADSLTWALWGILSAQLALFVRDIRRQRRRGRRQGAAATASSNGRVSDTHATSHFAFRKKNPSTSTSAFADDDVNPWRKTFVAPLPAPSISAYPSQHSRQRSSRSVPSSFDPYSPTAVHPSPLDADSNSMRFPAPSNSPGPPSVYLTLSLSVLYVFICVRTMLGTAQFWRVAVEVWGSGPSDLGHRWVGLALADFIGPIIFIITVAYFIHALYFSPSSSNRTRMSGPVLRSLALKSKANILPEPYSFPFPPSPSSTSPPLRHRIWRPAFAEPALLALTTLVVTVCGFVQCAKVFKDSPPAGAPVNLDAVTLIWYVGQLAIDSVLCVLLCRALGPRLASGSWMTRTVRVMGEAGGTQLVVAFLALVLIVSWQDGKQASTLTMVAPALLPTIYANTVFLHAASAYLHPSEPLSPRTPLKAVGAKIEDIEMDIRRPATRSPAHVDLASAAAAAESAYSTTADSADGGVTLRAQAMAYGREKEATAATRMHLERDTSGEGSTGHPPSTGAASASETAKAKVKALSVRSGVSTAFSLELPTFRRGRARWRSGLPMDDESGSDPGSDEWDEEIELDSEEDGGGTWDYGFANAEREKERTAAATMLAGASASVNGNGNDGGTKIGVQGTGGRRWQNFTLPPGKRSSYPAEGPSRPVSWRRSVHPLATSITNGGDGDAEADENDDTLSMLSETSTRRRRRHSYYRPQTRSQGPSFNKSKSLHRLLPRAGRPPLPPVPSPGPASASTDSVFLTGGGLSSPAGSVLVIGRAGLTREPSIAEQSVNAAASVAATRASTGSMWSTFSYTYPRPLQLPDLDVDLQGGLFGDGSGSGGTGDGSKVGEQEMGDAHALGALTGSGVGAKDSNAPHPYSAAGVNGDTVAVEGQEGTARRRWNVHPLKRIAEMGRLRF